MPPGQLRRARPASAVTPEPGPGADTTDGDLPQKPVLEWTNEDWARWIAQDIPAPRPAGPESPPGAPAAEEGLGPEPEDEPEPEAGPPAPLGTELAPLAVPGPEPPAPGAEYAAEPDQEQEQASEPEAVEPPRPEPEPPFTPEAVQPEAAARPPLEPEPAPLATSPELGAAEAAVAAAPGAPAGPGPGPAAPPGQPGPAEAEAALEPAPPVEAGGRSPESQWEVPPAPVAQPEVRQEAEADRLDREQDLEVLPLFGSWPHTPAGPEPTLDPLPPELTLDGWPPPAPPIEAEPAEPAQLDAGGRDGPTDGHDGPGLAGAPAAPSPWWAEGAPVRTRPAGPPVEVPGPPVAPPLAAKAPAARRPPSRAQLRSRRRPGLGDGEPTHRLRAAAGLLGVAVVTGALVASLVTLMIFLLSLLISRALG